MSALPKMAGVQKARLENWRLVNWYGYDQLVGEVWDHPVLGPSADGEIVHTSEVIEMDSERDWAITRNTLYSLGQELPAITPKSKSL
jgi:hypothetical protein